MGRNVKHRGWDTYDNLYKLHVTEERSTVDIAKLYDTYPVTVRRALKRLGIPTRNKSEAQKVYFASNEHPMSGRERSQEERDNISKGSQAYWDGLTPDEAEERRSKLSELGHKKWSSMDDKEKAKSIKKMHKANREKAGQGSRNENMVAHLLEEEGFVVVQRTTDYTPGGAYEIDIAIPSKGIAIEWDGAAHYESIYGDDVLARTIAKDQKKNNLLTSINWTVIRCRDHSTAHSLAFCKRAVALLLDVIGKASGGQVYELDIH